MAIFLYIAYMAGKYKYAPVAVQWKDSSSITSGWLPTESLKDMEVSECLSVGFILQEDKEKIIICSHLSNSNQNNPLVNGSMVILKKQITKINKL